MRLMLLEKRKSLLYCFLVRAFSHAQNPRAVELCASLLATINTLLRSRRDPARAGCLARCPCEILASKVPAFHGPTDIVGGRPHSEWLRTQSTIPASSDGFPDPDPVGAWHQRHCICCCILFSCLSFQFLCILAVHCCRACVYTCLAVCIPSVCI